jgi:hypothetical protein
MLYFPVAPSISASRIRLAYGGVSLRTLVAVLVSFAVSALAGPIPYVAVPITAITNSPPNGPWKFNTHASVTGYILDWQVNPNLDGDRHIVVCDNPTFVITKSGYAPDVQHCIVAETVPYMPCSRIAKLPYQTTLSGTVRFDAEHDWWELHPVERIAGTKCYAQGQPSGT